MSRIAKRTVYQSVADALSPQPGAGPCACISTLAPIAAFIRDVWRNSAQKSIHSSRQLLRGAVDTIQRHRPVFLIEAEDRHRPGATAELFAFFDREDYAGWYVHKRQFVPVGSFDLLALQNPDALMVDGGRKPGMAYINNFWFFPQESSAAKSAKFAAR